jgi:hypothetical protein
VCYDNARVRKGLSGQSCVLKDVDGCELVVSTQYTWLPSTLETIRRVSNWILSAPISDANYGSGLDITIVISYDSQAKKYIQTISNLLFE